MEFKNILKNEMKIQKISAYKLAKETGIKQQSISNYLNGNQEPTISNLIKICDYLEVSTNYILGRKETYR